MKTIVLSITLIVFSISLWAQSTVYINEISYKDINTADRGVEIAGPANTNLTNWSMEFVDNNGAIYHTETITNPTTIDNEMASGKGGIWIPVGDLQDNDDRTIILYDNNGTAQDTVSYGSNPFVLNGISNQVEIGVVQTLVGTTPQNLSANSHTGWWVLQPTSKGDLNVNQVLPVELTAFQVALIDNIHVSLKWETDSEMFNSHFDIEKSNNGFEFIKIGTIEGNGTTLENHTYEFTDIIPQQGNNYYRLKQVDTDGKFEYSDIVSINISEEASIIIAPNPVRQNSELKIFINDVIDFDFVLMNMTGQIVQSYRNIDENIITINDLSPGIYMYQIQANNQVLKTDKLIIIQ